MPADSLRSAIGVVALLAFAWALSERRRSVPWRTVGLGLGLTVGARGAAPQGAAGTRRVLRSVNDAVDAIAAATRAGTSFVFGYLGGGPLPVRAEDARAASSSWPSRRCRSCW